ncbi:MAG: hypothetical protein ACLP62_13650 [Acidimicrobiales bacterium]
MISVAVVALIVVVVGMFYFSSSARAQTGPFFKLSVTPTQDLTSGQAMTLTVTRTPAGTAQGLQIYALATGWCTADFQVPTNVHIFAPGTPFAALPPITGPQSHCTTATHPLSSTYRTQTGYSPPRNTTGDYPTVSATVAAQSTGGTTLRTGTTLICDADHSCSFVVLVYVQKTGATTTSVFLSVPVTYLPPSINTDCGGAAPGQLTTVGPDRLGQQITNWTLGGCSSGLDGGKAVTQNLASGQSDSSALSSFADGDDDLAYSAVGYGATAAFTPASERPYVAVPIALNAVVVAHVQSKHVTNVAALPNVFARYPQLYMTDAQAAQMVGGGPTTTDLRWKSTLGKGVVSENPTLGPPSWYWSPTQSMTLNSAHSTNNTNTGVVASSEPDATTLFATTFFHTVVPHALVSASGKPLGVTSDFGTATPPFNVFVATGTLLLGKALSPGLGQGWALTDAATAAATWGGLSVVALQIPGSIGSEAPSFVAPTVSSMQAAVPEMIPQPDGTLMPNPDAAATNGVAAYPLTYVEYAIAPTQPLLNDNCTPRTKSQQNLVDWLNYITGAGQSELDGGLAPLTPALQRQARQAIAQVGKATPTGPCAPVTAPASGSGLGASAKAPSGAASSSSGSTAATTPGALGTTGAFSQGTSPYGSSAAGAATTTSALASSAKTGTTKGTGGTRQVAVDLAGFKSYRASSLILPVLGILFLIVFLPGLALMVADGSLRGRLDRLAERRGRGRPPRADAP